jgi:RNase P subunit RPR2
LGLFSYHAFLGRCELVNAFESMYCSKCRYPLVPSAFEEIKAAEDSKILMLQEKYERDIVLCGQKWKINSKRY